MVRWNDLFPPTSLSVRNEYAIRDALLKTLGYPSYQAYCNSGVWISIRDSILKKTPRCFMCDDRADLVHHFAYPVKVLRGIDRRLLFPMCRPCHELIELEGRFKRTLYESQCIFIRMLLGFDKEASARRVVEAYTELMGADAGKIVALSGMAKELEDENERLKRENQRLKKQAKRLKLKTRTPKHG